MGASSFVGRVGGLAVALGIGAAMTTGAGIALADGTGESAGPSNTSDSRTAAPATESTGSRGTANVPAAKSRSPKSTLSKIAERVRDGKVSDSGGALTSRAKNKAKVVTDPSASADQAGVSRTTEPTAPETRRDTKRSHPRSDVAVEKRPVRASPDVPAQVRAAGITADAAARSKAVALSPTVTKSVTKSLATAAVSDVSVAQVGDLVSIATVAPVPATKPAAIETRVVAGLLAAVGLGPAATNSPATPAGSPALLALMAWARREFEAATNPAGRAVSVAGLEPVAADPVAADPAAIGPVATALALESTVSTAAAVVVDPNMQTPQPVKPAPGTTTKLGWVTWPGVTTGAYGTPGNYGIAGTDLGIMWDDGMGNVLMLFGDTFDQPNMTGVWRSNVLLRSVDHVLSDENLAIEDAVISPGGVYTDNAWSDSFGATQVIRDPGFLGLFGSTTTIIPTAAISVTDANGKTTQYANIMSVRTWDTPGRWTTNWSAIAYSEDGGLTWTTDRNTVRSSGWLRAGPLYRPGEVNFQQGAFVMGQDTDVNADGVRYVYSYGTPSGRGGSAYLSRVPEDQILALRSYEYWAGEDKGWVRDDPSVAVPVIGATDYQPPSGLFGWIQKSWNDFIGGIVVGGTVGGNVSELSVQYNEYLGQYVVLYTDGSNNVVMRTSDSPQGVWSEPTTLVANDLITDTGMYAPMIHPWSGTDQLGAANEQYLYWNLSWWGEYNVRLMQTDLSPMAPTGSTSGTVLV